MKGNYKIGFVVLLFLTVTTVSAITEIGDNILATWVNASFFKGNGTYIESFNGSNITSGIIPTARLPNGTVILLYSDETDSAELSFMASGNSAVTTFKSYVLPANSYSKIIVEAEGEGRTQNVDAVGHGNFTWFFNESTTIQRTLQWRIFSSANGAAGTVGLTYGITTATIKTSFAGGQSSGTTLSLAGYIRVNDGGTTAPTAPFVMLARSFRVYGVV